LVLVEHFPKPGTKAEARMLADDEKNIEETSESDSGDETEATSR